MGITMTSDPQEPSQRENKSGGVKDLGGGGWGLGPVRVHRVDRVYGSPQDGLWKNIGLQKL